MGVLFWILIAGAVLFVALPRLARRSPRVLAVAGVPEGCVCVKRFRIAERALQVSVYHHPIGAKEDDELSCWTYVSDGLRAHGQKEVVLSVARREGEPVDGFPEDVLHIYSMIYDLSQARGPVDIGGYSELGTTGPGLLERDDFRGILYTPPQLGHFPPPTGPFLTALVLTRGELHVALQQGTVRLMALLGHHYHRYPTVPWNDRDREEIVHIDALKASIIGNTPRAGLRGVTVCEEAEEPRKVEEGRLEVGHMSSVARVKSRIVLRVARTVADAVRKVLAQPGLEEGMGLMTDLEPTADACYTWRPGQKAPSAIAPAGRTGRRICGDFVIFAGGQAKNQCTLVEDGFGVTLTDEDWGKVREALAAGTPLCVPTEGDIRAFEIAWTEEPSDAPVR
jgi:hypothetical protein